MKKVHKYIIGVIVLVLALVLLALYNNGSIGVSETKIEAEGRRAHHVNDNWQVSKSISYPIGVLLFYDAKSNDSTYSIFLNRKGFSYGYSFRAGGSVSKNDEGICELNFDGYGRALISMNKAKIERIEIDDGQEIKTINVDSTKPFTLALPGYDGIVTMYDINNNIVPIAADLANN